VGWSNVFRKSSNSTGSVELASGIVAPALYFWVDVPGVSCTYFRPSAERARMMILESTASGWTVLSSFMFTTAIGTVFPCSICTPGLIVSTTPTRKPPTRTSLPGTRFEPFGTRALRS
jgi:hypothetical protein